VYIEKFLLLDAGDANGKDQVFV